MNIIIVGSIYIDPKDRDVIKITKITDDEVEFDIIKDPNGLWKGSDSGWWYGGCILRDYVICGKLTEALYL